MILNSYCPAALFGWGVCCLERWPRGNVENGHTHCLFVMNPFGSRWRGLFASLGRDASISCECRPERASCWVDQCECRN